VLRASAVAEAAGVPSVSLVCEGFMGQAATTSVGLGMPNLPLAMVPGHVDVQSAEELKANIIRITLERVINGLTAAPAEVASLGAEPGRVRSHSPAASRRSTGSSTRTNGATACRSFRRRLSR
jgi:hypothetical protein